MECADGAEGNSKGSSRLIGGYAFSARGARGLREPQLPLSLGFLALFVHRHADATGRAGVARVGTDAFVRLGWADIAVVRASDAVLFAGWRLARRPFRETQPDD